MQDVTNERLAFTRNLLSSNRDKLEKLADLLLEHESVDAVRIREEIGLLLPLSGSGGPEVVRDRFKVHPCQTRFRQK